MTNKVCRECGRDILAHEHATAVTEYTTGATHWEHSLCPKKRERLSMAAYVALLYGLGNVALSFILPADPLTNTYFAFNVGLFAVCWAVDKWETK